MAFNAEHLASIEAAIGTGELTVEINGKRVTYRSMADLMRARDRIKSELVATESVAPRRSYAQRVRA